MENYFDVPKMLGGQKPKNPM